MEGASARETKMIALISVKMGQLALTWKTTTGVSVPLVTRARIVKRTSTSAWSPPVGMEEHAWKLRIPTTVLVHLVTKDSTVRQM